MWNSAYRHIYRCKVVNKNPKKNLRSPVQFVNKRKSGRDTNIQADRIFKVDSVNSVFISAKLFSHAGLPGRVVQWRVTRGFLRKLPKWGILCRKSVEYLINYEPRWQPYRTVYNLTFSKFHFRKVCFKREHC